MKKQALGRLTALSCFFVLATLIFALPAKMQNRSTGDVLINAENGSSSQKPKITIQPFIDLSNSSVLHGGGTILVRTSNGVYMSMHAFGLTPGNVVTAWFGFFNNPNKCATNPCTPADLSNPDVQGSLVNATGRIVGPDGTADFGAFRAVGDTFGAQSGPGLLDSKKAQIHLAVRSHGPAILDNPQTLREQLTMFTGGCPPNTCATVQLAVHQP